jgi:hypothetical protein
VIVKIDRKNAVQEFSSYLAMTTSLKGGGGKSTFACALLDYLRSNGFIAAAYDADGAVGSFSDMHGLRDADGRLTDDQPSLDGVFAYNMRDESRATLINSLQMGHRLSVHDVGGGALSDVQRLFSDKNSVNRLFRALQACDACVIFYHLVTPDISTIESIALHLDLTDQLGPLSAHARHVAVLNRHGNRSDQDFPNWFGYLNAAGTVCGGKTRERLLAGGGAEMSLPALQDRTMSILKDCNCRFSDAVQDSRLTLLDQQRIQIFVEDFQDEMTAPIRALLGLV